MTKRIITILISIVTCMMPLITTLQTKAIMYYLIGITLIVLLIIKRKELKLDTKDKILLGFYALAMLSTIFAVNKKVAVWGSEKRYEGILMLTVYFLLFYVAKYYFQNYKWFYTMLLSVATIISIYAVLQFYNIMPIHDWLNIAYWRSFSAGTMINRNFMRKLYKYISTN